MFNYLDLSLNKNIYIFISNTVLYVHWQIINNIKKVNTQYEHISVYYCTWIMLNVQHCLFYVGKYVLTLNVSSCMAFMERFHKFLGEKFLSVLVTHSSKNRRKQGYGNWDSSLCFYTNCLLRVRRRVLCEKLKYLPTIAFKDV